MALLDANPDDGILASTGDAVCRLTLRLPRTGGAPVLVDATGAVINPWEVELLRWPPSATAALRSGGYLTERPADLDLWCNCAD